MNSNFEHLVNTPAPDRAGQIDALRMVDFEFLDDVLTRELHNLDYLANTWVSRIKYAIAAERSWSITCESVHEAVDGRVANRSARRKAREQLAAIRALRKEFGL